MISEFLDMIIVHKEKLNASKKEFYQSIKMKLFSTDTTRYRLFYNQISQKGQINLIAEIKKASPSKGLLRENFDIMAIADAYVKEGAAAISVLTEDKYFLGKPEYAKMIGDGFNIPVLIKDFIIDEGQIYEARYVGASAILLIVAILDQGTIKKFLELAAKLDLDCIVEVHNEAELKIALDSGADIIGVNNRNLHTFEVNIKVCERLIENIPAGKVIVAESGISTHEEVEYLEKIGANAVLIGETFMKAEDIPSKIREIMKGSR